MIFSLINTFNAEPLLIIHSSMHLGPWLSSSGCIEMSGLVISVMAQDVPRGDLLQTSCHRFPRCQHELDLQFRQSSCLK